MSKVIITLKPNGTQEVKTEGAPGESCRIASGPYQKKLGGQVVSDTPTNDAYLPDVGISQNQQIGH